MYNDYLPEFLREIADFRALGDALDAETERLSAAVSMMDTETRAQKATEEGLSRFESMLKLKPKSGDGAEIRRVRILSRLSNRVPYTVFWLLEKLSSVFGSAEAFTIAVDPEAFELSIEVDSAFRESLSQIKSDLLFSIPANMGLVLKAWTEEEIVQYGAFFLTVSDFITIEG